MAIKTTPQPPYPIHHSVKGRLDPEYVAFYNEHIINNQQVHYQPEAASRMSGTLLPGAGPAQTVGTTHDYAIKRVESSGPDVAVRVFTPEGENPLEGWPVVMYFHGGGWVLGNINTENVICSHICQRARSVVVSVDYRLAPEDPFPAAVDDSWEAVRWLETGGHDLLAINIKRWAVAGSSAGGNLAAVMCQRAVSRNEPRFVGQVLVVPVTDNTAQTSDNGSWREYENTPALPAEKMIWYRVRYLPNEEDLANPEASPLLWQGDWSKLPPVRVIVGGLDVLREEGEEYAEKLKEAGVASECFVMEGMPHPFLAMDGVLKKGRKAITLLCEGLKQALEI
ncbi:hypothetical protein LTR36_010745 [Oleoguttula mirabilis]|uniref:Alpha/beta hydrolase fold-3 domain-containing protein n=1 Tax=Oleoguttula mirabilis TaxID=1507867 RepID=A0AAV9JTX1_9PEZI|nr:hypothetical protein LTR36_010745 [Oleoguttula mirabilis]